MPRTKKQATTAPAPIQAAPEKSARELPEIQRVLSDYCSQIIFQPSHEKPVENLLFACLGFEARAALNVFDHDEVDKYVDRHIEDWRTLLQASWPARRQRPDDNDRDTVTKLIRSEAREALRDKFETFAGKATPEEIMIMSEVMGDWNSGAMTASDHLKFAEVELGMAFERWFAKEAHRYIRVPEERWDLVRDYLKLLEGKQPRIAK